MPDELDCSDPFERWHQAWFTGPLELDFRVKCDGASPHAAGPRSWFDRFFRLTSREARPAPLTRLQPVCLGHLIYLQALDSPILKLGFEDVAITIPDFLTAIRILRDARWPFTAGIDFSATPDDERLLRAHTAAIARGQPSPVETALNAQFFPWWFACQQGPDLMEDEGEDMKSLSAPYALAMAVRLLRTGSFAEERVFTMPVALLRFYAAGISEQEGCGNSFLTKDDLEAMKHADSLPDLSQASDGELYAIALKEGGKEFADAWLVDRQAKKENDAQLAAASIPSMPSNGGAAK